jgi:Fe-S-cluster containining protein
MIHEYFEQRAYLGGKQCEFQCNPDCLRPGCAHPEMQVPVTIFDILGAATLRDEPVHAVFHKYYSLGVMPREGLDWIKSVSLKLKKPCPFLDNNRCSIYTVRPLSCILFPENFGADGTLKTLAAQSAYKDYLCLRTPFVVSRQRARTIRILEGMLQRELLISDSRLFDLSPFWIDFDNLQEELVHHSLDSSRSPRADGTDACAIIPFASFEAVFSETFAGCHPLNGLDLRIRQLDDFDQRKKIFSDLNDRKLLKSLARRNEDRPLVHKFVGGRLEARRQSLIPREHMFVW